MERFFELPLVVQASLGGGYLGYVIAYIGIRSHHKTADTAFLTAVFGVAAAATYYLVTPALNPGVAALASAAAAALAGVLWRILSDVVLGWFRSTDYSWSNDDPSAWAAFKRNNRHTLSQIGVDLDDGSKLICDNTTKFADAPFGPCCLGDNGDLALYVTHRIAAGAVKEQQSVLDDGWGDRITYVPAARIRKIEMRHVKDGVSRPRQEA